MYICIWKKTSLVKWHLSRSKCWHPKSKKTKESLWKFSLHPLGEDTQSHLNCYFPFDIILKCRFGYLILGDHTTATLPPTATPTSALFLIACGWSASGSAWVPAIWWLWMLWIACLGKDPLHLQHSLIIKELLKLMFLH